MPAGNMIEKIKQFATYLPSRHLLAQIQQQKHVVNLQNISHRFVVFQLLSLNK